MSEQKLREALQDVREMLEKAIDKAATNAEAVVGDADSGTGRFGRNPLTLPSGYVQVPVEPTQDWLDSVANRLGIGDAEMRELHSALLAATPTPSDSKPGDEQMEKTYWLIERGSPAEWWVAGTGRGDGTMIHEEWTRDASKAQHFNEWGAKTHAKELEQWGVKGPLRATEHMDCGGPGTEQVNK